MNPEETPKHRELAEGSLRATLARVSTMVTLSAFLLSAFLPIFLVVAPAIIGERSVDAGEGTETLSVNVFGKGTVVWTDGDDEREYLIRDRDWTDQKGDGSPFSPLVWIWITGLLFATYFSARTFALRMIEEDEIWEKRSAFPTLIGRLVACALVIIGCVLWFRNLDRCTGTTGGSLDWIQPSWFIIIASVLSGCLVLALLFSAFVDLLEGRQT